MNKFTIGDTAKATKRIERVDGRCALKEGQTAKVIGVFESRPGAQIVDLELSDGNRMRDIVCENGIPLVQP